jgi:hypothetical protein
VTARPASYVRGCTRALALFALAATWLTSTPVLAGVVILDEVFLAKGLDRQAGVIVDPTPYFFEVCIAGIDISGSTLPTLQTPPSTNFPSGSMQTLNQDLDEFCFERSYASAAAREADFPSGSYTVSATNVAETVTDSKQVNFSVASPTAYPNITTPASGSSVSTSNPTPVGWDLVDKGGCNLGQPATCLDFFVVGTFESGPGINDEVDFQLLNDPTATGTNLPGGIFQAGIAYEIEVEALRGTVTEETTDTLGAPVSVALIASDINLVDVTGEQPAQPIQEVLMFKGLDREDGVPLVDPYFIEICVSGSDIPTAPMNALPTVQTPPSTNFPQGTTQTMMHFGFEFCFEAEGFANGAALEASYPSGDYTISVTDNSQSTDTAVVSFGVSEPSGFPDVFDPVADATVPFDQNLQVQWGSLVAKDGSCNPAAPGSCTDGILLFMVDENTGNDVDVQQLPAMAGAATVSASVLQPSTPYSLEVETFRGSFAEAATSSTLGNPILLTRLYEDINLLPVTTVPEPGAVAMQLAALATLTWAARRRRRAR